jgi:hypothetical protein
MEQQLRKTEMKLAITSELKHINQLYSFIMKLTLKWKGENGIKIGDAESVTTNGTSSFRDFGTRSRLRRSCRLRSRL